MLKPIRLMLTSILVKVPFVVLLAAPHFAIAKARSEAFDPVAFADLSTMDLLVFVVLGLAAVSAAVAVRMVRRRH
jgi:hypothetical protein